MDGMPEFGVGDASYEPSPVTGEPGAVGRPCEEATAGPEGGAGERGSGENGTSAAMSGDRAA